MKVSENSIVFLVLYVDDILLIGNDIPTLQHVKTWLESFFSINDLGKRSYVLGIRIYRYRSLRLIGLSQSTYIDKVLRCFSMHDSRKGFVPASHGMHLSKGQCLTTSYKREHMSKIPYAFAIRSIIYTMVCTQLDVSYALSMTSKYQSNFGESH